MSILTSSTNASLNESSIFEALYLDWVRNIGIFIVAAIALSVYPPTKEMAFWIFIISIFLFVVIQIDYLVEREQLVSKGINIPIRIDWLWILATSLLFITIWVAWRIIKPYETNGGRYIEL